MSKKIYSLMAILMIATLVLVACGNGGNNAGDDDVAETFKACEITDTGGVDDKSFNQMAWKGVEDAIAELGIEGKYLESQQQTDYELNFNAFVEEGCDIIIPVGFLLADATIAAAEQYPEQTMAIVDVDWVVADNVAGIMFQTDQAAFLAGYLSAGVTQTGKVGTYGGIPIPSVTIFMDGFWMGVQKYNEVHGTEVEVVGWDPANPDSGLFTNNFDSLEDGRNLAISMMDEGVDIIMPVAGPVGLGSAAAIQERGDAWIVGVDADWTESTEYADIVLTSVVKKIDVAIYNNIKAAMDGTWVSGTVINDLAAGGVGLGKGYEDVASAELIAELDELSAGIIAGEIQTSPTVAE